MKRISKVVWLIVAGALLTAPIQAQSLNIFTQNDDSKIYVDEELVAYRFAKNLKVSKGSHLVRVQVGKQTVFSEVVTVPDDGVKTISVERFVGAESPLANRGSTAAETKRAMESRGKIALGLNGSYMPGVSLKGYLTPRWGLQATGWFFSFNDQKYSSWETRVHYNIVNTLLNKMPGSLYFATGYGNKNSSKDDQVYFDAVLGIEASLTNGAHHTQVVVYDRESLFAALLASLLFLDNAYVSGEIGYGSIEANDGTPSYQGIVGRVGIHYYF